VETFPSLERSLLRRTAVRLQSDLSAAQIAEQRRKGFGRNGYGTAGGLDAGLAGGQLLESAREIEKALGARAYSAAELIELYTGAANWAELDTLHRRLERRASSLEFAFANLAEEVEQLVHAARRRHQEVSGAVAERFVRAWKARDSGLPD